MRRGRCSSSTATCSTTSCCSYLSMRRSPVSRCSRSSPRSRSGRPAEPTPATASGCRPTARRSCRRRSWRWPRAPGLTASPAQRMARCSATGATARLATKGTAMNEVPVAEQSPFDQPQADLLLPAKQYPQARAVDQERIERAVREILLAVGEDPDRDGLIDTPARVARMYAEQFAGLRQEPEDVLTTVFDAEHDEIVLVRDIEIYSMCEHHLVPFF